MGRGIRGGRGGGRPRCKQRAKKGSTADSCRALPVEHLFHARDAGGVEAQRLVERRCALPRDKRKAYRVGFSSDRGQGTGTLNMIVIVKGVRRTQRAGVV